MAKDKAEKSASKTPDVAKKNPDAKSKKSDKSKESLIKKASRFLRELKSEFKKIVWPSKKQVVNNTLVVIGVVLVMGIAIWILDFLFIEGFGLLY